MTDKEKQKKAEEINKKIFAILKVNWIDWFGLDRKLVSSLIMVYQQGLTDAEELLKGNKR